jgi:hypothetical protein
MAVLWAQNEIREVGVRQVGGTVMEIVDSEVRVGDVTRSRRRGGSVVGKSGRLQRRPRGKGD